MNCQEKEFPMEHNTQNSKYTLKERILKAERKKDHVTYKDRHSRITSDFLTESLKV